MPQRVVKDITIKKKPQPEVKRVDPPVLHIKEKPIHKQDTFIYKKRTPSRIPRKIIFICILVLVCIGLLFFGFYSLNKVTVLLTPRTISKQVNESITLSSWSSPITATVMTVTEQVTIHSEIEEEKLAAHAILENKIEAGFRYNIPQNYILINGCKTTTRFSETETTDSQTITSVASANGFIIKKSSLEDYLIKQMRFKNTKIEEMSGLACELKKDIAGYTAGTGASSLSVILSGEIITKPIFNESELKESFRSTWLRKAEYSLAIDSRVENFNVAIKPFSFIHFLPYKAEKIVIQYTD